MQSYDAYKDRIRGRGALAAVSRRAGPPAAAADRGGLGERASREPGRRGARALLHTAAAGGELDELNGFLLDRCITYARTRKRDYV